MQELHELQEEKLLLAQIKAKGTIEKTQRKSVKRASKYGSTGEISAKNQEEMTQLVTEQGRKVILSLSENFRLILLLYFAHFCNYCGQVEGGLAML